MSEKSKYAETLNALVDMQSSVAYAVRRQTLINAEQAIVELEQQRDELLAAARAVVGLATVHFPGYHLPSIAIKQCEEAIAKVESK